MLKVYTDSKSAVLSVTPPATAVLFVVVVLLLVNHLLFSVHSCCCMRTVIGTPLSQSDVVR